MRYIGYIIERNPHSDCGFVIYLQIKWIDLRVTYAAAKKRFEYPCGKLMKFPQRYKIFSPVCDTTYFYKESQEFWKKISLIWATCTFNSTRGELTVRDGRWTYVWRSFCFSFYNKKRNDSQQIFSSLNIYIWEIFLNEFKSYNFMANK